MTEAEKPEVKEQAPSGRLLSLVGHLNAAYQSLLLARFEAKALNLNHSLDEIYQALNYIEGAQPGEMPNVPALAQSGGEKTKPKESNL